MRSLLHQIGFLAILATCASCAQSTIVADGPPAGSLCEVHLVPLQTGTVPIEYGYPVFNADRFEARQRLFPNSRSFYHAGCVVKSPTKAIVNFCPDCRKAESQWNFEDNQRTMPVREHYHRVKDALQGLERFDQIHIYLYKGGKVVVGLEGSVRSESDLAELRRIIKSSNPPSPVEWSVKVIGNESR